MPLLSVFVIEAGGRRRWREKKAVGWQGGDPADMSAKYHNAFLVNIQPLKKLQKFLSRQLRPGIGRRRT